MRRAGAGDLKGPPAGKGRTQRIYGSPGGGGGCKTPPSRDPGVPWVRKETVGRIPERGRGRGEERSRL